MEPSRCQPAVPIPAMPAAAVVVADSSKTPERGGVRPKSLEVARIRRRNSVERSAEDARARAAQAAQAALRKAARLGENGYAERDSGLGREGSGVFNEFGVELSRDTLRIQQLQAELDDTREQLAREKAGCKLLEGELSKAIATADEAVKEAELTHEKREREQQLWAKQSEDAVQTLENLQRPAVAEMWLPKCKAGVAAAAGVCSAIAGQQDELLKRLHGVSQPGIGVAKVLTETVDVLASALETLATYTSTVKTVAIESRRRSLGLSVAGAIKQVVAQNRAAKHAHELEDHRSHAQQAHERSEHLTATVNKLTALQEEQNSLMAAGELF